MVKKWKGQPIDQISGKQQYSSWSWWIQPCKGLVWQCS